MKQGRKLVPYTLNTGKSTWKTIDYNVKKKKEQKKPPSPNHIYCVTSAFSSVSDKKTNILERGNREKTGDKRGEKLNAHIIWSNEVELIKYKDFTVVNWNPLLQRQR